MADRITGATAGSEQKFVIDAGAIMVDGALMGATQGGVTFAVEQDMRQVEVDGHRSPIVGGRRVISETARITGQLLEMTEDNLSTIITGSDATSPIQRMSDLPNDGDYVGEVKLIGRIQGSSSNFEGILKNALNDGGFEIETSDENEATIGVQFTAHTPIEEPDASPWSISFPTSITT